MVTTWNNVSSFQLAIGQNKYCFSEKPVFDINIFQIRAPYNAGIPNWTISDEVRI